MTRWQMVTFPAWPARRYVGLAEVLVRLGGPGLELEWACFVDELAPEPGLERLAELPAGSRVGTLDLLAMVAPNRQVIEGRFDGYRMDGELVCRLRAVDSSDWDVEAVDPALLAPFAAAYPGARGPQPAQG